MGGPSLGPSPKIASVPSMVDPTVLYARMRERIAGNKRAGRESTILQNPLKRQQGAPSTLAAPSLVGGY